MSDQDDYFSGQNLGLAVILTGHVSCFQKIIRFISGKYKQLNKKISQRVVVTKWNADVAISVFENIRIRVDRGLMFFQKLKVFTTKIASNESRKLIKKLYAA